MLRLTANDAALTTSDDIVITRATRTTMRRSVERRARPDDHACPPTASLDGTVTDDGLPQPAER